MELYKLGQQTHTHTAPAAVPHKPRPQTTDGNSTLTEAHAAEHEEAQPGCLACLQQYWESVVQYVQDLWASLFDNASAPGEEVPPVGTGAKPLRETDTAPEPTPVAQTQGGSQEVAILSKVQEVVQVAWKAKINALEFPCVVVGRMHIFIGIEQPITDQCVMSFTQEDGEANEPARALNAWYNAIVVKVGSCGAQLQSGNIVFTLNTFSPGSDSKARLTTTVHQVVPSSKERPVGQMSDSQQMLGEEGLREVAHNRCPGVDIIPMLKAREILKTS